MMQGITTDKDHTIPTLIPTVKQQGKVSCDVNSCLLCLMCRLIVFIRIASCRGCKQISVSDFRAVAPP